MSSTARETPAPASSAVQNSKKDPSTVMPEPVFFEKDKKVLNFKVKKPSVKQNQMGNWDTKENKITSRLLARSSQASC